MKTTDANLTISISVECPNCDEDIELLNETSMTDDGYIYREALSDDGWGCQGFNTEFECPQCKERFIIRHINY